MKRILSLVAALMFVASLATSQVILNVPSITVKATKVAVNISDVTGKGVVSAEIVLVADTNDVEITGFSQTGTLTQGMMSAFNNQSVVKNIDGTVNPKYISPYSKGRVIFAFASATPLKGSGPIVNFIVKNKSGKTAYAMITYYLLNENIQFGIKPQLFEVK